MDDPSIGTIDAAIDGRIFRSHPGVTMQQASTTSVFVRRLAAAVVLPGVLTSMLVLVPAAHAANDTASICNGVVNQLAHRGTVQENLLKAAARKNAVLIASSRPNAPRCRPQQTALRRRSPRRTRRLLDLKLRKSNW